MAALSAALASTVVEDLMDELKRAFMLGMKDGWEEARAPFVAFVRAAKATWTGARRQAP